MTRPLIGITSYNRRDLLEQTIRQLWATAGSTPYELAVFDNGSQDGSVALLDALYDAWQGERELHEGQAFRAVYHPTNIGCPRALNRLMEARELGQPFVKVDNDVAILTPGWIETMAAFEAEHPDAAMIGAWYDGVLGPDGCRRKGETDDAYILDLLPGHFVWHTGRFLDRVGYFEVLHPGHLYGFEDWMMCHKAAALGMRVYALKGVEMRDLQAPAGSYAPIGGAGKREHVEAMRPHFLARLKALREGKMDLYTPASGVPYIQTAEGGKR